MKNLNAKINVKKNPTVIIKNETFGITLIALVITIVVLLILAGISIAMVVGDNGVLNRASQAKINTKIEEQREIIELALSEIQIEKIENDKSTILTKDEIKNEISKSLKEEFEISSKIIGEEFVYIVTIDEREFGIRENNTVEYLGPGIRNKYIEITEAASDNTKVVFENTITQQDVDGEVGKTNSEYEIIGISDTEDGEYITSGTIAGKAGTFEIIDIANCKIEYTLNNFMQGDEIIYLKVLINNELEKIQKLTVVQGDVITYEEDFVGIAYSENWYDVEDENCSGGKCKVTDTLGEDFFISIYGTAIDFKIIANIDTGTVAYLFSNAETNNTIKLIYIDYDKYTDGNDYILSSVVDNMGKIYFDKSNQTVMKATLLAKNVESKANPTRTRQYLDAIIVYR